MAKVFISYSHSDNRKKEILEELLNNTNDIEAIVVANRDEPANLLSNKVKKAIKEADFLIPILTSNSIYTQWINQEIGYSEYLSDNKKITIVPIVEKEIMDSLNQFIHKQQDLPFHFNKNMNKRVENKAFKAQCLKLIEYLKTIKVNKINIDLHTTFTNLYLKQINDDQKVELGSTLLIENISSKNIVIKEIEITLPYNHYNINRQKIDTLTFKTHYYKEDGSKQQLLNLNPFILKPNDIRNIYKLFFISKEPILIEKYIDKNEYRTPFIENLNKLKIIETTFYFQDGEILNHMVKINR
jgi:uncharacterized protein YcfL